MHVYVPRSRDKFPAVKQTTKVNDDYADQLRKLCGNQLMETKNQQNLSAESVAELIQRRATWKVLGDVANPVLISPEVATLNDPKVVAAIKAAGWAPFHYDRAVDGIAEPWRAHVLWNHECRTVANKFFEWFEDVKPNNKLPAMLSACGALVLVTWLPQFRGRLVADDLVVPNEKQIQIDEEHLAATAAMVQNLLLVLTAEGMGTYWSSGGQFQTVEMFERLGIPSSERLLAAVFVEYPETMSAPNERLAGKQRANRAVDARWLSEVGL